jgi:hypothetical protein
MFFNLFLSLLAVFLLLVVTEALWRKNKLGIEVNGVKYSL